MRLRWCCAAIAGALAVLFASAVAAVFMAAERHVRAGGWISVGVSAGGFATVALAAEAPRGLVAAISFTPGRGSTSPDTVCGDDRLVEAFARYGASARIPLLWVSAANDRFFGPRLVDRLTGPSGVEARS